MRNTLSLAISAAGLALSLCTGSTYAATWNLTDVINPSDYDNSFDYFNDTDPTNGLVLYQSESDAKANNLTGVSNGKYFMRVDTTEVQTEGRRSIRLSSKQSYSDGVFVLNVSHVPTGCATWPAFWTVTENLDTWPTGGEIDIMENFSDLYSGALSALHTASSCITPSVTQSGTVQSTNCSAYTPNNEGCAVINNGTSTPTWGSQYNSQGGGVVAMERSFGSTGNGVRIWFWNTANVPSDIRSGSQSVDPSTWGTPSSFFNVANRCHSQFGAHKITFDITLCGDASTLTYNQTSCSTTYPACSYQVGYNGSSFDQSYWSIGSLRIFATGGSTDNAANSPNTTPETSSTSGAIGHLAVSTLLSSLALFIVATVTLH